MVTAIREGGKLRQLSRSAAVQIIKKDIAKKMVSLLSQSVSGGEAKFYNIEGYTVAGKTGTAQIPVGGVYDPSLTNATFVGFFPGSAKYVMLVKLGQPKTSPYAAETAVPLWMDLAHDLIRQYGIQPDL